MVMMMSNNGKKFSLETIIRDVESGKQVFHFRPGQGNVRIGMVVTRDFIQGKLGIPLTPPQDRVDAKINNALRGHSPKVNTGVKTDGSQNKRTGMGEEPAMERG